MNEKKKPSHSVFSNAVWSVGALLKNCPSAFVILALMIPANILIQYLGIYLPAVVVSEVTEQQPLRHALFAVGGLLLALLLAAMVKTALGHIQNSKLGVHRYKLEDQLRRKGLDMFYQTIEKKEVRDLAARALAATQMWNGNQPITDILTGAFDMAENVIGYLLFGTVISFASPWLVPLLTVAPVVNLLAVHAYNRWEYSNRAYTADLNQKLDFVEELPDNFSTAKDIRIYSMADWLKECFSSLSRQKEAWDRKDLKHRLGMSLPDLVVILIRDGGAYALLISMFLQGKISVDQFVLYFAAIASFAGWVDGVIRSWNNIRTASLFICDFREYLDYPDSDAGGSTRAEDHLSHAPEIVFDRVSFRYDGAEEDTIRDLSFTLRSGEKLAVVGMNGAGKTTLVKLLCGLYRPTGGEIRINGIPLIEFRREDYYRLLSPVFQDVHTAFFSLAETVSCTDLENTDLAKAEDCIRRAGLGEKVNSLPDGILTKLNKQVNRDGTELSGGEAQKLMLARALYKNAPLLVLDEPTAALDPIAESRIYTEYSAMCENKTSLFISHRLASTAFCDRIILLDHGRIAEEGSHAELISKGGEYAKLYEIQSVWYRNDPKGGAAV